MITAYDEDLRATTVFDSLPHANLCSSERESNKNPTFGRARSVPDRHAQVRERRQRCPGLFQRAGMGREEATNELDSPFVPRGIAG
jgi:hypothetical protein